MRAGAERDGGGPQQHRPHVYFQKFSDGKRVLRVFAPLGVLLPPGLGLKIDDKDVGHAPFVRCHNFGLLRPGGRRASPDRAIEDRKNRGLHHLQTEEAGIGIPISLAASARPCRAAVTWEGVRPSLQHRFELARRREGSDPARSRHFAICAARKSDGRSQRAVASCTKEKNDGHRRPSTIPSSAGDSGRAPAEAPRCLPPVLPPPRRRAHLLRGEIEDLADSFPGLLFAFGDPYATADKRERAFELVCAGEPLRQVADALGYLGGCANCLRTLSRNPCPPFRSTAISPFRSPT